MTFEQMEQTLTTLEERTAQILDRLADLAPPQELRLYSYEEAAAVLGCSPRTVKGLVHEGKIDCFKDGNRVAFTRHQLDAYVRAHEIRRRALMAEEAEGRR